MLQPTTIWALLLAVSEVVYNGIALISMSKNIGFSPRMPDLHRNSSFDTDIGTGRQRVQYIYIRYGM